MPVAVRRREGVEEGVAAEPAVEDDDRLLGEGGPHLGCQGEFTGAVGPEGGRREQVGTQGEERYEAQLRIAGALAVPTRGAPEVRDVLGRVGDAQRGAVEAVDGQAAPAVRGGRGGRPRLRRLREQGGERGGAELIARLDNGSVGDAPADAARGRHDQVEMVHDLRDAAVAEQAHADDEPHHVLGGQLAAAHRCGVGRRQRVGDPLRVDRRAALVETRRALARAQRQNGLPHLHRPTSVGETNYYLWIKRSRTRSLTR